MDNGRVTDWMRKLSEAINGWGFAAFIIFTLCFTTALFVGVLLLPFDAAHADQFAEQFRIWCYGYDPNTGSIQWAYAVTMITSPLLLAAFTAAVWASPLRAVMDDAPRRLWWAAGPAAALVAVTWGGLGVLAGGARADTVERVFAPERLRTAFEAPAFELTDQDGEALSLDSLDGRVVVVTGIYASCGQTCPLIMNQLRTAVHGLSDAEKQEVSVVAITLDPERDDPAHLSAMARAQGVETPLINLVTGDPATVNDLLDRFSIARRRDPTTGIIDHANVFIVIDRQGKIAFRFALGEQQGDWLAQGIRYLLAEARPNP